MTKEVQPHDSGVDQVEVEVHIVNDGKEPTLDQVLVDLRSKPYRKSDFREFLERVFADENLEFYDFVEEYRQRFAGDTKGGSPASPRQRDDDDWTNLSKEEFKQRLLEIYIAPSSEREINISEKAKQEITQNKDQPSRSKGLFDAAQAEVKKLLEEGLFHRFLREASNVNIMQDEIRNRLIRGVVLMTLGVALAVTIILLEINGTITNAPYNRLYTFIPFFFGAMFLLSSTQKVCIYFAMVGLRQDKETSWIQSFLHPVLANKLDDFYAKAHFRWLGIKQAIQGLCIAAICTSIVFFIPTDQNQIFH